MDGFPYENFPTGWFQVEWSAELEPGVVKPMRIFDQEVVLYRTENGTACVVSARCPHMGAHVGYGGQVVGESISCPFHGWEFGVDGKNCRVPWVERANPKASLESWDVHETSGFILVWYDALGRAPFWRWPGAPEFLNTQDFYEPDRHRGGVRKVLPHQPLENGPDMLHFPYVHGAGEPATIVSWSDDDHRLVISYDLKFGANKASSRLTPQGAVVARLDSDSSMSVGIVRFTLDDVYIVQAVNTTPVDHDHSLWFSTTVGRRQPDSPDKPGGRTKIMMESQHAQIVSDFNIWEHQSFIEKPLYAGVEEKNFPRFRKWLAQFYPEDAAV
ncbi:MAG: Rieske 2Fe-2S domain-containing protein [Mycobacterium sp.]|uniref:Rieske 2Fe-2S domain-containing protein n=1 Tax=Mycobacterium sp. TaxID=1785 RepID=UPI003C64173D